MLVFKQFQILLMPLHQILRATALGQTVETVPERHVLVGLDEYGQLWICDTAALFKSDTGEFTSGWKKVSQEVYLREVTE
jgi:hypothetical protein